jgi:RNA polymerase sigma factor (sigma-70 family)
LPKFKGDSAFYTWLFRITMNLALDRRRQRVSRARSMGAEDVAPEEWERTAVSDDRAPDDEAASAERRAQIGRALESLSEQHRSIIILSDIEGLSYREIAEVLEVPMGTVMSRLHNARKRLRDALGPGFLAILLVVVAALPAVAQVPGAAPPAGTHVCVNALVILASNQPGATVAPGPRLAPTPPLRPPGAAPAPPGGPAVPGGPPAAGRPPGSGDSWSEPPGGCGSQIRLRLPRLQEVFGYSHFEPMSAFETIMPVGTAQRFALPGGRELVIHPLAIRPPVVRVALKVLRGPMAEIATVMDVPPRRPAYIGGPPHGAGVLIIAIRSRAEQP